MKATERLSGWKENGGGGTIGISVIQHGTPNKGIKKTGPRSNNYI